jgi:LytS/YehU family sensor histidine kinase
MQAKYETEKKDKEILVLNLEAQKKKNTIWGISFGFIALFVFSGSGFVVSRNKKKREKEVFLRTISETDMKALRSQMNPHFIFNCIHTINGLLSELKIQESKTCLDKFSHLTRSVLENSKKREIPLLDELETLRLYIDLENMRFSSPFQYIFSIEPSIDPETTLIPPLILQPFVENSIKHGFRDPKKTGLLKLEIRTQNETLICSIEDNGVGRTSMVNIKTSSGFKKESLGIKLTEERLDLISKTKKVKSHFLINDLVDGNNNPTGTLVKMYLPLELSV